MRTITSLSVLLFEHVPAQAPFFHRAGLEVLDQHVGLRRPAASGSRRPRASAGRGSPTSCCGSPASTGGQSPLFVMVPNLRRASPTFGSSILMTSAPNSASCVAAEWTGEKARHVDDTHALQRLDCRIGCGRFVGHGLVSVALPLFASGGDALSRLQDAPCPMKNG